MSCRVSLSAHGQNESLTDFTFIILCTLRITANFFFLSYTIPKWFKDIEIVKAVTIVRVLCMCYIKVLNYLSGDRIRHDTSCKYLRLLIRTNDWTKFILKVKSFQILPLWIFVTCLQEANSVTRTTSMPEKYITIDTKEDLYWSLKRFWQLD